MASSRISPPLKHITKSFAMPQRTAGAQGYDSVAMGDNDITNISQIVSVVFSTTRVAGTSGLQLTPVYYNASDKHLYYEYYSSTLIEANSPWTVTIWYI